MDQSLLVTNGPDAKYGEAGLTRLQLAMNAYQLESARLARFPDRRTGPLIFLGLVEEAAEVVETVLLPPWKQLDTVTELGDLLWYVAAISDELAVDMSSLDMNQPITFAVPMTLFTTACHIVVHAGRVAGHMKKTLRDHSGDDRKESIIKELGNVLVFASAMAELIDLSLEHIMHENLIKLRAYASARETGKPSIYVAGLGNGQDAAGVQKLLDEGLPPITFKLQGCPCGSCVTCACGRVVAVDQDGLCMGCGGVPLVTALLDGGTPHVGPELEGTDREMAQAIIDHFAAESRADAGAEGGQ